METTNLGRFDARTQRWTARPPREYAGLWFRRTVVVLFVLGCVLQFFH
jgi:hypothetical protein